MSKIRDAMRKSENEYLPTGVPSQARPERPAEGPLGLVPSLSPEILAYYESVGKQIEVALGSTTSRALLFTAAVGEEGVSTVISQYAEMLSRRGERVLLVDGNPRHPSLHRIFNVQDSPGLAEFVGGTASREAVVHATGFANLSLIPLGRCSDRSQAERITDALGEFLQGLSGLYDYVLVDMDFAGSAFLSRGAVACADGVVFVIRAGKTNRQVVGRSCDMVRRIGGQILGVVLNRRSFPIPEFIYRRL
ncbi:MAG TPA: CpsD/CapB family tyrosine-protein kinase [bacterium]|nr:CpsD/CapB family tyrosine-protein kinase [bacterium]